MALVLLLLAALGWKIEGSEDLSGHGILPSRLAHGFSTSQRAWSNRELSLKNMIFVFMVFSNFEKEVKDRYLYLKREALSQNSH